MTMTVGKKPTKDSLILCLDAGNLKSYYSGSSLWKDLSGNGVDFYQSGAAAATNDLTFETLEGVNCFQFNEQKCFAHDNGADLDLSGAMTLEFWVYFTGTATRTTFFEKVGTDYASYYQEIAMTFETDDDMSWFYARPSYDYHRMLLPQSQWIQFGMTRDTGDAGFKNGIGYINGQVAPLSVDTETDGDAIISTPNQIRIGRGYAANPPYDCFESGNYVSIVRAYNRELSAAEMEENFNSDRARFGV